MLKKIFILLLSLSALFGNFSDFPNVKKIGDITVYPENNQAKISFFNKEKGKSYILFVKEYDKDGNYLNFKSSNISKNNIFYYPFNLSCNYQFAVALLDEYENIIAISPIEPFNSEEFDFNSIFRSAPISTKLNISTQTYPVIYLEFLANENYTQEDMKLLEDNSPKNILSLRKDKEGGSIDKTKLIEIVFIIDISMSMKEEISHVKANIKEFEKGLKDANLNYKIKSIIAFGDDNGDIKTVLNLDKIKVSNNGKIEKAFDAIYQASNISWSNDTEKMVILFTDENSDEGQKTEDDAITLLKKKNINFYALTKGHLEFTRIAKAVDGKIFNITSTFNSIIPKKSQTNQYRYNLAYQAEKNVQNSEREVKLEIEDKNLHKTIVLKAKYTPPTTPAIKIKIKTDLAKPYRINQDVNLNFEADRVGGIDDVDFYLIYGEEKKRLKIDKNSKNLKVTIPKVKEKNLSFYIEMDDKGRIHYLYDTESVPYKMNSLSNNKPKFISGKITPSISNQIQKATPIDIEVKAKDIDGEIDKIYMRYCTQNCYNSNKFNLASWYKIEKKYQTKEAIFKATIPSSKVYGDKVLFYIKVVDNYGSSAFYKNKNIITPFKFIIKSQENLNGRKSKTFGKLRLQADSFKETPSTIEIEGDIKISLLGGKNILRVDNGLIYEKNSKILKTKSDYTSLIALNIKTDLATKDITFYVGGFSIDSKNASLTPFNKVFSIFSKPPVKIQKDSIKITSPILGFASSKYFSKISNLSFPKEILLSQGKKSSVDIGFKIEKEIGVKMFKLTKLELKLKLLEPMLNAKSEFEFDGFFNVGLNSELEFLLSPKIRLNKIGLEVILKNEKTIKSLSFPPPVSSPLYISLVSGGLEVDNIASNKKLKIKGKVGFMLNDSSEINNLIQELIGKKPISGEVYVIIDLGGKYSLNGEIKILETLDLAKATLGYKSGKNSKKIYFDGGFKILFINGELKVAIYKKYDIFGMSGKSSLSVAIPKKSPFLGGMVLSKKEFSSLIEFNKNGLKEFKFRYSDKILWLKYSVITYIKQNRDGLEAKLKVGGYDVYKTIIKMAKRYPTYSDVNQTLHIDKNYDFVTVRVVANAKNQTPKMSIKLPNGAKYRDKDVDIDLVDNSTLDKVFYRKNPFISEAFFSINKPEIGDYQLEILNEEHLEGYVVEIVIPNKKPNIEILSPNSDITVSSGSNINIAWQDKDEDNNADITFYLDDDKEGYDGFPISDVIKEDDTKDNFDWKIPNDIESGKYYLYAKIDDKNNAPTFYYNPNPIEIESDISPKAPQNLSVTPKDGALLVKWDKIDEDDILGYRLYLNDEANSDGYKYDFATDKNNSYEIQGLANHHDYKIAVKSINKNFYESKFSQSIIESPNGESEGGNPDLTFDLENSTANSDSGKLEGEITLNLAIKNISQFQSYSAKIKCYYGEINNLKLIDIVEIGGIEAKKSKTVTFKFNTDNLKYIKDKRRLFLAIEDVQLPELNQLNNYTIFKLNLSTKEDLNQDYKINIIDIMKIASKYQKSIFDSKYDLNKDDIIDELDIKKIAEKWGD